MKIQAYIFKFQGQSRFVPAFFGADKIGGLKPVVLQINNPSLKLHRVKGVVTTLEDEEGIMYTFTDAIDQGWVSVA